MNLISDFIFEPCTLGDGKNDKCVECPPDRPISIAKFDSSFFYEPPDVCKNPHEVCVCAAGMFQIKCRYYESRTNSFM